MQDIAGCRVIVANLMEQDRVINDLKSQWPDALIHDRRARPSYGYRAVHVVVFVGRHPVEIQVRTPFQHSWASVVEKLSDVVDPDLKYGGGPQVLMKHITAISDLFASFENAELIHANLCEMCKTLPSAEVHEGLLRFIETEDEKSREMGAEIIKAGGIAKFLARQEVTLKKMRKRIESMLQRFCKRYNIRYKGVTQ
jgi:hypothetical protein